MSHDNLSLESLHDVVAAKGYPNERSIEQHATRIISDGYRTALDGSGAYPNLF